MGWGKKIAARAAAISVTLPLLTACVNVLLPEDIAHIKTVGVISGCADKLTLKHTGTTIFTGSDDVGDITDWKLDAAIVDSITAALNGRYEVLPVSYDPANFRFDPGDDLYSTLDAGTAVRDHAKPDAAPTYDAYIVVSTKSNGNQKIQLKGLGVHNSNIVGIRSTALYTSCTLTVVDGHTFKPLVSSGIGLPGDTKAPLIPGSLSTWFVNVDSSYFADTFAMLTPAQKEKIHVGLEQHLKEEMPVTLRALKFIP